jgi:hypothetical protein
MSRHKNITAKIVLLAGLALCALCAPFLDAEAAVSGSNVTFFPPANSSSGGCGGASFFTWDGTHDVYCGQAKTCLPDQGLQAVYTPTKDNNGNVVNIVSFVCINPAPRRLPLDRRGTPPTLSPKFKNYATRRWIPFCWLQARYFVKKS